MKSSWVVIALLLSILKWGKIKERSNTDIIFENKIVKIDSVKQGTLVKAEYNFKNIGENNLYVEYINPDCICTGYSLSDSIIAPNNWGTIQLNFGTKKDLGVKKLIAVMKTNTDCKFYKLILKVNILE